MQVCIDNTGIIQQEKHAPPCKLRGDLFVICVGNDTDAALRSLEEAADFKLIDFAEIGCDANRFADLCAGQLLHGNRNRDFPVRHIERAVVGIKDEIVSEPLL